MSKYKNGQAARVGDTVQIGDTAGIVTAVDDRCNGVCVALTRITLPGETPTTEFWKPDGTERVSVVVVQESTDANNLLPIAASKNRPSAPKTKKPSKKSR